MPLILGISGSLREGSHNTVLLRAAATQLPPGVSLEIYDELREIPPYDADLDVEPADPAVSRFREAIARADAWLLVPGGAEGFAASTPVDAYMLRD